MGWCSMWSPSEEQQEPSEKRVGLKDYGSLFTCQVTNHVIELLLSEGPVIGTVGNKLIRRHGPCLLETN